MKALIISLLVLFFVFIGCEKNDDLPKRFSDGFCIVADGKVVLSPQDFEYYDYAAHLIYLKDHTSFAEVAEGINEFKVYADRKEIYSGRIHPMYSSSLTNGVFIRTHPSGFGDYIIRVEYIQVIDSLGSIAPDLREDERIVHALKRYNQFHAGLECEIKSIVYKPNGEVTVELLLQNNDDFSYCYIDPEKTGTGLFHYFTNGLYVWDYTNPKYFTHQTEVISPDPWNAWEKDWLSVIPGKGQKLIAINYPVFEEIATGSYHATFQFPGLAFQVKKEDIQQEEGQIWLGKVHAAKKFTLE